ncbi:hypothetical protein TNCT_526921 [Trichonephila clavata]|uniref:Uncharacterized protein n=1 Tax=Trichonephila clavata TaxID=2740835 RepID=A0A8X6HED5_TRICU|nr:hypothetical protein TNCT_526921 [Trichonephila clavata]
MVLLTSEIETDINTKHTITGQKTGFPMVENKYVLSVRIFSVKDQRIKTAADGTLLEEIDGNSNLQRHQGIISSECVWPYRIC